MIKTILLIFTLISGLAFADAKESERLKKEKALMERVYANIERDIILVRKKAKYSTRFKVRLFELYIERFNLLRKKENAIFLENASIDVVKKKKQMLRKNLMSQFKDIAILERDLEKTKARYARKELGRLNIILAEISRDLNNEKEHLYYLRKADKYVYRQKYRYQVNVFFAEHYYNKKKYSLALKYYAHVLKNKENYWYSKHLYNASWCYLKLDKFDPAISLITQAIRASRTTSYVNLGSQALDHLSLFYAISNRTEEALKVLPTLTADAYSILVKFSTDTVRFSKSKNVDIIFNKIEKYVTLPTKRLDYLLHKIKTFRKLTRYNDLQNSIDDVATVFKLAKGKSTVETKEGLVTEVKSYTGLLQERFVKGNISPDKKDLALSKIMKNFDILSLIDRDKSYEYLYFQGETLYGYKKFSTAIGYYQKSISYIEEYRKKEKDSLPLIDKRLNAIFSSIENMEAATKIKEGHYEYAYQKYLEYFPKTAKARSMYQKLFTLYFKNKKHSSAIKIITRYNDNFPTDQKFQKSMYDDIMRYYIKRKDAVRLSKLIEKPKDGYLGYTKADVTKFQEILYQIYFTVYNKQLAKKDYKSSIKGFSELFANEKVPYSVRYRAGLKALEIYSNDFKNDIGNISNWSVRLMKSTTKDDFIADRTRYEYIIQMFASNGHLKESYKLIEDYQNQARKHKLPNSKFKSVIETKLLLALALEERRDALKAFEEYREVETREQYRVAYNKQMLNHFIMTGKESYIKGYVRKYKNIPEFAPDFDTVITGLAWREFDEDGNASSMRSFIQKELPAQIYKGSHAFINEERSIQNLRKVAFKRFNEGPVTFESFSGDIEKVIQSLQQNTQAIDQFIKDANAKAVIRTIGDAADKVGKLAEDIGKYVPVTPDNELKKAILIETKKLEQVVARKKSEYLNVVKNINKNVALFDLELFELKKERSISEFFSKPVDMKMFTSTIHRIE